MTPTTKQTPTPTAHPTPAEHTPTPGEITLPVHLRIGDTEALIGTLTTDPERVHHDLAAFLRAAADAYDRAANDDQDAET